MYLSLLFVLYWSVGKRMREWEGVSGQPMSKEGDETASSYIITSVFLCAQTQVPHSSPFALKVKALAVGGK